MAGSEVGTGITALGLAALFTEVLVIGKLSKQVGKRHCFAASCFTSYIALF